MRWVKKTESAGNGQARWREAGSPSRRRRLEDNETTASGQDVGVWQDVGGGDAAGRTPARPGETGSQDDDDAALGQKHPSTEEIIYIMYPFLVYHRATGVSFLISALVLFRPEK